MKKKNKQKKQNNKQTKVNKSRCYRMLNFDCAAMENTIRIYFSIQAVVCD